MKIRATFQKCGQGLTNTTILSSDLFSLLTVNQPSRSETLGNVMTKKQEMELKPRPVTTS
jgi:hypothetical protein